MGSSIRWHLAMTFFCSKDWHTTKHYHNLHKVPAYFVRRIIYGVKNFLMFIGRTAKMTIYFRSKSNNLAVRIYPAKKNSAKTGGNNWVIYWTTQYNTFFGFRNLTKQSKHQTADNQNLMFINFYKIFVPFFRWAI